MSAESDFMGMILEFMADDPMTATYHQYTDGGYDPDTSTQTDPIQVDTSVQGILLDLTRASSGGFSFSSQTLIQDGDREFFMLPTQKADPTATPIVPNPTSDRITVGSITYRIVLVKTADPTGSNPLLYDMLIRI